MPQVADGEHTGTFTQLKAAVAIDKNDLDTCLVEQPDLFYRVSEAYTMARSLQDEIKYDITKLTAELGAQFRSAASDDKKPPSVEAVNHMINNSPKMVDLQKEMLVASTTVGKWAALKEAYDMRASALKSLTQLFSSNYFTVQTGSRTRSEAVQRFGDDVREASGVERRNRPTRERLRPSE